MEYTRKLDGHGHHDWRLPTKDEWSAMIHFAASAALNCGGGSSPSLTNDAGTSCYGNGVGSSFVGVAMNYYWSSSSLEDNPLSAWVANLYGGSLASQNKTLTYPRVWPVRGAPR